MWNPCCPCHTRPPQPRSSRSQPSPPSSRLAHGWARPRLPIWLASRVCTGKGEGGRSLAEAPPSAGGDALPQATGRPVVGALAREGPQQACLDGDAPGPRPTERLGLFSLMACLGGGKTRNGQDSLMTRLHSPELPPGAPWQVGSLWPQETWYKLMLTWTDLAEFKRGDCAGQLWAWSWATSVPSRTPPRPGPPCSGLAGPRELVTADCPLDGWWVTALPTRVRLLVCAPEGLGHH